MQENAGNLGLRLPYFKHMVDNLEVNILAMAYRGYSYSDPVAPTEIGLMLDGEAILRYLENDRDNNPSSRINYKILYILGRSLGGAVSAHMLYRNENLFRGAIIENTFLNIEFMAEKMFPYLKPFIPYILRIGWFTNKIVPGLTLPILYVTGDQDEIVPYEHTLSLHKLTQKSVFTDLYVVKNGDHNSSWYIGGVDYLKTIQKFLKRSIKEYQLPDYDQWNGGKRHSTKDEQLDVEKEANSKVKIKTTVLPKGSLDKLKKEANEKKKLGGKIMRSSDDNADINDMVQ